MPYACTAATEMKARCRNWAEEGGDWMCAQHNKMRAEGKPVERAPASASVEFKFNVNRNWARKLAELGVQERQLNFQEKEEQHVAHAEKHGRDAFRYRKDMADSGVPVFGLDGLVDVSVYELFRELVSAYDIVDIYLRPTKPGGNQNMKVLVIYFAHGGERKNLPAIEEVLNFLASSCWGHCHVWANPPGLGDKVKNTVNTSHREPNKAPSLIVRLAGGLFSAEEAAP